MNQSKFSLADLLTLLGALGFGFFCFLSLNFLSLGKTVPSVIVAAVLALLLGGLALGAKILKRTSRNFKTCIILEWVLLFLFVMVAIFATRPFSHYFAVSDQKAEIQQTVTANIAQAENLFTDYEAYTNNRENIYKSKLSSVVAAKNVNPSGYDKYGFVAGIADSEQVENKLFVLHAQLFPSNFAEMKQVDSTWLAQSKATVANWKPIGIVTVMNKVESEVTSWKEQLKLFSAFRAQGESAADFDYPLTFAAATDKIENLQSPTPLAIGLALGLYLVMLMSYFITKRHSRYHGQKVFGTGGVKDNEL